MKQRALKRLKKHFVLRRAHRQVKPRPGRTTAHTRRQRVITFILLLSCFWVKIKLSRFFSDKKFFWGQGKMSKKLQAIILIVLSLLMTVTITACSTTSWKAKSRLNNPTQIEVYGNYLYFLDTYSTIKIYDRGAIYDLTSWLPEEFRKENTIMDFAVVNPSKIAALTGSSLYLIDVQKKESKKIFSDKDNFTSMDL
ncbi:MAG: hypothetical protein QMC81_09465, partial [Thermoanaerobacterales bacterium]|nr:hypothetical protein [Thermoanaerobacterales bacterium]